MRRCRVVIMVPSARKQLAFYVPETLEFERIPRWVKKEQGTLLPRLTLETDVRLDNKMLNNLLQPGGERLPVLKLEHDTAMRYRHTLPIYRVGDTSDLSILTQGRVVVYDELMPEHIEIDPLIGAAALR